MEAPAQVVVHTAGRHRVQGVQRHVSVPPALDAVRVGVAQQQRHDRRPRELGRRTEAALLRVVAGRRPRRGRRQVDFPWVRCLRGALQVAADAVHHRAGRPLQLRAPLTPHLRQPAQHVQEAGPAVGAAWRKVGAPEHRAAIGRQKHRHGPAARAARGLHHRHVDAIDVGPLLAVELDGHEVVVQERGHRLVLERLVRHHVAPVAGGVPHRQEHQPVLAARPLEGGVTPRVPLDRVVGVLQQVGALFVEQTVRLVAGLPVPLQQRARLVLVPLPYAGHPPGLVSRRSAGAGAATDAGSIAPARTRPATRRSRPQAPPLPAEPAPPRRSGPARAAPSCGRC